MKKILAILLSVILLIPAAACQSGPDQQQRTAMLEYLRSGNVTLNSLPQASQYSNPAKDLKAVNQSQLNSIFTQFIAKYQDGLQNVKSEKVPDIADAKSFHETSIALISDSLIMSQKMQTALNSGDQAEWAQSVDEYVAFLPRVTAYYRLMESLLSKYNISDSDVDYKFRGK